MKKILSLLFVLIFVFSCLSGCGTSPVTVPSPEKANVNLGSLISETKGNTNAVDFNFESAEKMLEGMTLACENDKFALYYSQDNMSVALKDKSSEKVMLSNPYNAAMDENYSGNVANRLNSQVVLTYLEEEKSLVDMYSSKDCSDLGQYVIKTYENGIVFDMSIGEEKTSNTIPMVFTKARYEEIYNALNIQDKELLDIYYVYYKKSDLKDSGIYDIYPDVKAQDLYYCGLEVSEREMKKISAVFDNANYSSETMIADAEALNLGKIAESYPNFKLSLNYSLTDSGVKVTIPNDSISYNSDFPLLKVSLLPYFGADEAKEDASGYLFIPDGTGAIINMNQNEPNRRTIITGKVYGENASELPKKEAVEKTEQYYLPVFGTVRNNDTAIFGIISNGDGNSQITALLGRPNGNFYTTYPEFIVADYEQYTRVSVVENPWSNKEMYLYDKNASKDDLSVEYSFLTDEKANYSAMAEVYRNYIFDDKLDKSEKAVINIETLGSALNSKNFLGFEYEAETVLTTYQNNIEILKNLKENNANNVSIMLRGWQKDGLDSLISNKVRVSSDLGGKSQLENLIKYCNDESIDISLYNNISFVKYDGKSDNFKTKEDATRTLELQYAKNSVLSPDTMLYDEGSFVVKASSYNKYLTELTIDAKKFGIGILNLGELGTSLNADYSSANSINRSQALSFIKETLNKNAETKMSFDGGNAYVLPYASSISNISNDNSGFMGESAAIPFLQMVIGANANYNSEPINLKENTRYELLKCIESGTVPTFLVSYDNTSSLKGTSYTSYFAVDYKILKDEILESYGYLKDVISKTNGGYVKEHKILAENVVEVTYENGIKVYINKSNNDFSTDEISVKSMDYMIKE